VGFKPTIPAFQRAKTVHAADRAATVMGILKSLRHKNKYGVRKTFPFISISVVFIEN
jgi:hypothetical protein